MATKHSYHSEEHHHVIEGNREDMLLHREKQAKDLRKSIDKVLKDFEGQPFFLVMATDVDNGKHTQVQAVGGGVGSSTEYRALMTGLGKAQENISKNVAQVADPMDLLGQLLKGAR